MEVPGLDAVFDEFESPFEDLYTVWIMSQVQKNEISNYVVIIYTIRTKIDYINSPVIVFQNLLLKQH